MISRMRAAMQTLFFVCLFLTATVAFAQQPVGGDVLQVGYVDDSLNYRTEKDAEGFYHHSIPVTAKAGSRLYVFYSPYGPNSNYGSVNFIDSLESKTVTYNYENRGKKTYGIYHIDTTFTKDTRFRLRFTTTTPNTSVRYTAQIYLASPEALQFKDSADFCWQVYYLAKHAQNGFRFIRGQQETDAFGETFFRTKASLVPGSPDACRITKGLGNITYRCVLGGGSKTEADAYFKQLETLLRQCLGSEFNYTSTTANNLPKLICQRNQSMSGIVVHNPEYNTKKSADVQPRYIITAEMNAESGGADKVYTIIFTLKDAFYQY